MSDSRPIHCPRCGAALPAAALEQLCPACLMSGALVESSAEDVSAASGQPADRVEAGRFPRELGGYRLLRLLGRGGMGAVFEAEQLATGRRVALKMLGQQLDSPEMRQRFLREGRLAAGISHPNSLYVFGSEEVDGLPVITMEIAGGGTLKDKLKERGPLPVTEAVDAILDVIAGLEAAFAGGVLHRDIKPSNCFVSSDGSVKVGDFGLSVSTLAQDDSYVTATGVVMGTPAFAPPEQLRGDELDVRTDIYSVGATLFTLLTGRAPFEGSNAVQVVASVVKDRPSRLAEHRDDVPPGLERIITRCLAKEPEERWPDYPSLRNALLPFSSREPEPASIKERLAAGWIDFLIALLPPYVTLMLLVGAEALLVQPVLEPTVSSARFYLLLFGIAFLYFSLAEGIWGAGLGKWLKGLRVVRTGGRRPGLGRALLRIAIPILAVEGVRMPLMMAVITDADWSGLETALVVVAAIVCAWIPALLALPARHENGYATLWDKASGTRVVVKPEGTVRPAIEAAAGPDVASEGVERLGPYQIVSELVPDEWLIATDPVLRRGVWLLRRSSELSHARRAVARPGRLRWLQQVEEGATTWDAFEASQGVPFASLIDEECGISWASARHWLHDLTSELWRANGDQTLPAELSLDHVWITLEGRAILLDRPWPAVTSPAEPTAVGCITGQQRFLSTVAACVDSTSLPLHARPVLQNIDAGRFEKLSFLAGTLRGLLDRPAEVSRAIRAGSLFMLPLYAWLAVIVGRYHDKDPGGLFVWTERLVFSALAVLAVVAVLQLLTLPFRGTAGQAIFRLAVVNARGEPATPVQLLLRWAIVWLPLLLPTIPVVLLMRQAPGLALGSTLFVLLLWIGTAVVAVVDTHRGWHDQLAGTWVVRR